MDTRGSRSIRKELKALNEASYSEAIKALEDKYITNTQ